MLSFKMLWCFGGSDFGGVWSALLLVLLRGGPRLSRSNFSGCRIYDAAEWMRWVLMAWWDGNRWYRLNTNECSIDSIVKCSNFKLWVSAWSQHSLTIFESSNPLRTESKKKIKPLNNYSKTVSILQYLPIEQKATSADEPPSLRSYHPPVGP